MSILDGTATRANIETLDLAIEALRASRFNAQHLWEYRPNREAAIDNLMVLRATFAEARAHRSITLAQQVSHQHLGSLNFPSTGHLTTMQLRPDDYEYHAICSCGWTQPEDVRVMP